MPYKPQTHRMPSATAAKPHVELRSSTALGYGRRWQAARLLFLAEYPLCVQCEQEGVIAPATEVDHIVPHKGDAALFWDREKNWQPLCKSHHSQKTAREDGGFGLAAAMDDGEPFTEPGWDGGKKR